MRHAEALRLRLFALEVFFLGTAMVVPEAEGHRGPVRAEVRGAVVLGTERGL